MKPKSDDLTKYKKLTAYLTDKAVRKKTLPIPVKTILRGLEQGKTQSMLARELERSRSAISQRINGMRKKGLLPPQIPKQKVRHDFEQIYDKRNRSLKWKLEHPVKLPLDDTEHPKGLSRGWRMLRGANFKKEAVYFVNMGKNGIGSLEIYGGLVEGETPEKCNYKHDFEALNIYKWLCSNYPELEGATGGIWNYEVNRKGELNDKKGEQLAKLALEQTDSSIVYFGSPPIAKADRSLGKDELQLLKSSDDRIDLLDTRLANMEKAINTLVEKQSSQQGVLERLTTSLEKLIGIITPKEPVKESPQAPEWKPDKNDYR